MTERPGCTDTRMLLPELATGIAPPSERARAFRHIATCGWCHRELESRTALVDELLLLIGEREPPAGFEAAVMAPLTEQESDRRRPRRRRLLTAAAWTVSLLLVGGLVGGETWQRGESDRRLAENYRDTLAVAGGHYLSAARVTADDATAAGYVFAYQGSPSWLFVTMTAARVPGRYEINLTTRSGGQMTLGDMTVRGAQGSWGATVPVAIRDILLLRFRDPAGQDLVARLG